MSKDQKKQLEINNIKTKIQIEALNIMDTNLIPTLKWSLHNRYTQVANEKYRQID